MNGLKRAAAEIARRREDPPSTPRISPPAREQDLRFATSRSELLSQDLDYRSAGQVLVVDDEPSVARLTSLILAQCGFDVSVASTGAEALSLIQQNRESLRVVLLDYKMPDYDGFEVLADARRLGCEVPMILTTGYAKDSADGPPRGFAGFLQKPYRFAALVHVLRGVLDE